MKKFVTALLIAAFLLAAVAGCGDSAPRPKPSTDTDKVTKPKDDSTPKEGAAKDGVKPDDGGKKIVGADDGGKKIVQPKDDAKEIVEPKDGGKKSTEVEPAKSLALNSREEKWLKEMMDTEKDPAKKKEIEKDFLDEKSGAGREAIYQLWKAEQKK